MKTFLLVAISILCSVQLLAQKYYVTEIDSTGPVKVLKYHPRKPIKVPDKVWKDAIAIIRKYSKLQCLGDRASVDYWDQGGVVRTPHNVLCTDTSFVEVCTTWDAKRGSVVYGDWICYVYFYKGASPFQGGIVIKPEGKILKYIEERGSATNEMPPTSTPEGRAAYGKIWKRN
jgi:hypothetical protein